MRVFPLIVLLVAVLPPSAEGLPVRAADPPGRSAGMEGDGAGPMATRVKPVVVPETESPILRIDAETGDGRSVRAGYAVVQATFRTYDQDVQSRGPIDDVRAVIHALAKSPGIDPRRIALFGGSGGGNIALELGGDPAVRAVIAGEPATVLYTGMLTTGDYRRRLAVMADPEKYLTAELRDVRKFLDACFQP